MSARAPVLEVRDLETRFALNANVFSRLMGRDAGMVKAVDGVSFDVLKGEALGIVGESGSGKTSLARTLLGLVRPSGGSIRFEGTELVGLSEARVRPLRRRMQMVFQDPHASLNPGMTIGASVGHPLQIHKLVESKVELRRRTADALERVGLSPAAHYMSKYPGDLSGGQKQRAVIARAIILRPTLLIADEPVSMLDMSVRAKILELMIELKKDLDLTYVYVTHDLATAQFFCDRVAIMYLGKIVELAPARPLYRHPRHPYTQALLRAIPELGRPVARDIPLGEIPDARAVPHGCRFHPRCPAAFEVCGWEPHDLGDLLERRWLELPQAEAEREAAIVGKATRTTTAQERSRLVPGRGHRASELLELLNRVRAATPAERFWLGVEAMELEGDAVVLTFGAGREPRPVRAGDSLVECHLYDDAVPAHPAGERAAPAGAASESVR